MITPEELRVERSRITGMLEYAETHLERGNIGAVREALESARARLAALRERLGEGGGEAG
jgi:hypothetical protein